MARRTTGTVSGSAKGSFGTRIVSAAVGMVASYVANPENLDRLIGWVSEQHFPEKISNSLKQLQKINLMPGKKDPLAVIGAECDTVESLIETRSTELADDAPIEEWRAELDKIRRGVEFMEHAPTKDHKKIKDLQKRSKKLFNSAFSAAVD